MDKETAIEIAVVWRELMLAKRLQLDIVYNRVPKEHFSSEDLKKPEIAKQIEQHEYFDIRTHLPSNKINALEKLVELEYVEKQVHIIHQIIFSYEAHPYVPYFGWQGTVGISSKSRASNKILTIDTIQYENFKKSAKVFGNQIRAGKHRHITRFDYGECFQYETTSYELKDRYFDSLFLIYSENENRFVVRLVEPFTHTMNERSKKDWKTIRDLHSTEFLPEKLEIDNAIDELEWKRSM